jgi:hypothetical protein
MPLFELNGALQPRFRLLKTTRDARVASQIELNHRLVAMQLARSEQDRFCFLDARTSPRRIGQIDPPTCLLGLYLR